MSARAYLLLLTELLILSGPGCATLPGGSSEINGSEASASAHADTNFSKRKPRASTYVAFGELHEKTALEPGRTPAEQEQLREKARSAYQEALKVHPNDRQALMALARLYDTCGDQEHAVATYNRAIQVYPKDALLRHELGMCYARCRDWDLALQNLEKAVQADPENRRYGVALGLCLARAGHFDQSFTVLAKLQGAANAHYNLARMLHHLKQDEASKEQLRQALAENPNHLAAQQFLTALESGVADLGYPVATWATDNPDDN
jgi:tetratricopeptide (TPR) repeat protein